MVSSRCGASGRYDVTGERRPPLEGCMLQFGGAPSPGPTHFCGGPPLGELSGGKWMACRDLFLNGKGTVPGRPATPCPGPSGLTTSARFGGLGWPGGPRVPGLAFKIVTWLILPVVICLSQRLSHACLSISNYTVKLRMAH